MVERLIREMTSGLVTLVVLGSVSIFWAGPATADSSFFGDTRRHTRSHRGQALRTGRS